MSTISELTQKRELLLVQIACITDDLREYSKYPVETIDIEQIKYQYAFIQREIKQIDDKLKFILLAQSETLITVFQLIDKKIIENIKEKKFTAGDLPKNHYSLFNEPFI